MSYHPNATWFSKTCEVQPAKPERNRLALRLLQLPLPERLIRKRVYPGEWYAFWNHYYRGFAEPVRDLVKEDVTPPVRARIRKALAAMLSPERNRLLIKITGWPRMGFLKEIFLDAKFIHICRDGRAVASSLLEVPWWPGWGGPEKWGCGELSPAQRQIWERHGKSYVALAGIEWEILMNAFDRAKALLPREDYMELRYEALCLDPVQGFKAAADFSGLPWTPAFEHSVRRFSLDSANDKWRRGLTEQQQAILDDTLRESLRRWGYA